MVYKSSLWCKVWNVLTLREIYGNVNYAIVWNYIPRVSVLLFFLFEDKISAVMFSLKYRPCSWEHCPLPLGPTDDKSSPLAASTLRPQPAFYSSDNIPVLVQGKTMQPIFQPLAWRCEALPLVNYEMLVRGERYIIGADCTVGLEYIISTV